MIGGEDRAGLFTIGEQLVDQRQIKGTTSAGEGALVESNKTILRRERRAGRDSTATIFDDPSAQELG